MKFQKQLEELSSQKLDRDELFELLPKQAQIDHNINYLIDLKTQPITSNIDKQLHVWDEKITKLRNDFDVGKMDRMIKSKADAAEFTTFSEQTQVML
jgi:hypothetical protein